MAIVNTIKDGNVDVIVTLQGHLHQVSGGVVNFDGTSDRSNDIRLRYQNIEVN